MANFHVDSSGNLWLGDTSTTFTTSAPFYVQSDGTVKATSGTIGGISINSSDIQANYSAGTTGFLIESDGDAFFNSVTVNNPIITLGKDTGSGTPSTAANDRIKIGDAVLFNRDVSGTSSLVTTKSLLVLPDGDEDNPSIAIDGQYGTLGFFVDVPVATVSRMQITNGDNNVASWSTANTDFTVNDKLVLGGGLQAGGGLGSSGQVLQSTGSGVQWANAGGSHADSDHTSFADSSHNHSIGEITGHSHSGFLTSIPSEYLTETEGDGRYLTSASHGSHGTFVSSSTAVTSISSGGSGMKGAISVSGTGSGFFDTISQDTQTVRFTRSGVSSVKLRPASSSANYGLGDSTYRWLLLYSQFNTNVSSDERLKENIAVSDLGLDFINDLEPKKFTYIRQYDWVCTNTEEIVDSETSDCNTCDDDTDCVIVWTDVTGIEADAVSYGLIAQDVEQLQPTGTNWNLVRGEGDETKSIAYTELISPLIKAVQELSTQVSDLTARIETLEG